jgi:hypothetical protein
MTDSVVVLHRPVSASNNASVTELCLSSQLTGRLHEDRARIQNNQNYGVSGLCPASGILNNYKTFWKLDTFPSSGEGGGCVEIPTLLGTL